MLCFAFQLIHDSHAVASKLRKPPSDDETDTDEAAILQAVQLDKMIAKTNEALALQHVLESYRRYANLNRQQLELIMPLPALALKLIAQSEGADSMHGEQHLAPLDWVSEGKKLLEEIVGYQHNPQMANLALQ